MKLAKDLPIALLSELLNYCPETGYLTWRVTRNKKSQAGDIAGAVHPSGYRFIQVRSVGYCAHRIAYALHSGKQIPVGSEIDHLDGNRDNNAWRNLRLARTHENAQNRAMRRDNTSGYVGVSWHKQGRKWWAQITCEGKKISLGFHGTAEEAHQAYLTAKAQMHQFQPRPRK